MATRITVHFQSRTRWLMALVLKNCVPCWAQQYSDIPCSVVGTPFLSTILFPLTLSSPCFWMKVSSADRGVTSARQAHARAAIPASRVGSRFRDGVFWVVFTCLWTAFRRWLVASCSWGLCRGKCDATASLDRNSRLQLLLGGGATDADFDRIRFDDPRVPAGIPGGERLRGQGKLHCLGLGG